MEYLALIFFVISTSGTPGPNNVLILTSGVNHGFVKSIPHLVGINVGFPIMVISVGFGVMSIFQRWPILHQVLQIIGILYLLYLAYKVATTKFEADSEKTSKPFTFMQALLFQWVNPKAWVMAVSSIIIFSSAEANGYWEVVTIALFYILFGTPCTVTWLFSGIFLQKYLHNEQYLRLFNYAMAFVLILSLVPMVLELFLGTQSS